MKNAFETYFKRLTVTSADQKTEHTDRGALEDLLSFFAKSQDQRNQVIHESGREGDKGAPDFKVMQAGQILGYVENKTIDADLSKVLKSKQIERYISLSDNLLVTDYLQFIWVRKGKVEKRAILAFSTDLTPKFLPSDARMAEVANVLTTFFSTAPEGIGSAQNLALELAKRCRLLRDDLSVELLRQQKETAGGRLYGLYQVFRDQVFQELELKEFADAFAQTLGYGVFLAKYNVPSGEEITLHNVDQYVPASFELIRELVDFLKVLNNPNYQSIRWVVEEILSLINGLDLESLHEDLSFSRRKIRRGMRAKSEEEARLFEKDPYIYFYEDFLARYDATTRESRGVYYTPPPVVNFIVRAVNDILKDTFGIQDGLANHRRVTVLDFACGTGTFLLEVFEQVFAELGPDSGKTALVVHEHLLKNIYGFEYLIAPYTIAHLKLSQYLADKGTPLQKGERLQVFLTNTLEPVEPQANYLVPALSAEVGGAQAIKDKPILVVMGNPPYSGHSRNPSQRTVLEEVRISTGTGEQVNTGRRRAVTFSTFIGQLIENYKQVDGKPLGEKNPKWLNDDYVKFIRFAQWKMDSVPEGIVGIITNHSFLDNPTFRGMRQSLQASFNQIYVLDLHGSTKRRETAPDGSKDENVFDIQQGVSITVFVKKPGLEKAVFHADLWGSRIEKYKAAAETGVRSIEWSRLEPTSPFYLFIPQNRDLWSEYEKGWSLPDMMPINVLGFQTHRDGFAIAHDRDAMKARIDDLLDDNLSKENLINKYSLRETSGWNVSKCRSEISKLKEPFRKIAKCSYRPFDERWTYFGSEVMDRPRRELLDHVFEKENLSLLVPRQIRLDTWQHALVTGLVAESCVISLQTTEQNYVFPLYRYPSDANSKVKTDLFAADDPFEGKERVENFAPGFRKSLDEKYGHHFSPEEVLGYVYAVLHAPTYRERYAEFLRIDFPRIPLCKDPDLFAELAHLGRELIQKHLLKDVPPWGMGRFHGKSNFEVQKVEFQEFYPDQSMGRIHINQDQYFDQVPSSAWNLHIGGYQVLSKYLKDRKDRTLTLDEVENVENIVNIFVFTIEQMKRIDDLYKIAF